jgi:hypothetical protein
MSGVAVGRGYAHLQSLPLGEPGATDNTPYTPIAAALPGWTMCVSRVKLAARHFAPAFAAAFKEALWPSEEGCKLDQFRCGAAPYHRLISPLCAPPRPQESPVLSVPFSCNGCGRAAHGARVDADFVRPGRSHSSSVLTGLNANGSTSLASRRWEKPGIDGLGIIPCPVANRIGAGVKGVSTTLHVATHIARPICQKPTQTSHFRGRKAVCD